MSSKGRSLYREIWKHFAASISPKRLGQSAEIVGRDHFGNTYYETPANPQRGKRLPSRWYETKVKEDFEQEIPVEWEAWLRGRRSEVPSEEEIRKNLAIVNLKKLNAKELQEKEFQEKLLKNPQIMNEKTPQQSVPEFPKFDEYEIMPGEPTEKNRKE